MVINHTSDEHAWFQGSRDKESAYRDYYIWKEKPNNWTTFFMEKAWEYDEKSGMYYLHLFDKKQPDLNYKNRKVVEEMKDIFRFWLDKGAWGFRCDVINVIYKTSLEDGKRSLAVTGLEHYKSQEGCHEILRELRRDVLDAHERKANKKGDKPFTVGETVFVDIPEAKLLSDPDRKELDMLFYFEHLEVDRRVSKMIPKKFRAKALLDVLTKWQQGLEWNAVYLENHDQPRIVSHYGSGGIGKNNTDVDYWDLSAKMLGLMQLSLRGTPFIYQGQEIGMTNFDYTKLSELNDVESRNMDRLLKKLGIPGFLRWRWIKESSRDNARTPMQWDSSNNAGFTTGTPWLPVNQNFVRLNYAGQKNYPGSVLNFYKAMIRIRQKNECLKAGSFEPVYADDRLMFFRRVLGEEKYLVLLNFSKKTLDLPKGFALPEGSRIVISNTGRNKLAGIMHPWEGLLVEEPHPERR
jgi:oligo-1,6-glucosidase